MYLLTKPRSHLNNAHQKNIFSNKNKKADKKTTKSTKGTYHQYITIVNKFFNIIHFFCARIKEQVKQISIIHNRTYTAHWLQHQIFVYK